MKWKTHHFTKFFLLQRLFLVDLVSEDDERNVGKLWHLEQLLKLSLGFVQAAVLSRIDHEDDTVEGAAVVSPSLACLVVTTKVIGVEANVADGDLCLMRVQRGVGLCEPVALQHVEHSRLACVVEPKEDDVGALLEEAQPLHRPSEKVNDKHFQFC